MLCNPAFDLVAPWPAAGLLADQEVGKAAVSVAIENRQLVVAVLGETFDLLAFDRQGALVLVDPVAVEHPHLDDRPGDARRKAKRGVANVGGLFAEDGAEEL